MVEFIYKVRDRTGRVLEATAQAESPSALRARLASRGMSVVEIKAKKTSADATKPQDAASEAIVEAAKKTFGGQGGSASPIMTQVLALFQPRVGLKDLVVFSRQFASMVKAGVAILRGLAVMVEQCENKKMKATLESVRKSVEQGLSLSDAMAHHPDVFDRLFVAMIRAGETGGILDEVLARLAEFQESASKLTQKVQSAMYYPIAVLLVALLVLWGMLTFILPIFSKMFTEKGAELPAFTQLLLSLSDFVRSIWMLILFLAVVGAGVGIAKWYQTDEGRYKIDAFLLTVPIFGDLLKKVAIARFSRTFGTLIHSGVPMLSSLEVVKDTAGNAVIMRSIETVHNEVRQGGTVSKPLSRDPIFPPMVTQMVAIGEETGRMDEMLEKIADFYDVEVENAVEALTSLLEPIMVVGIGGIVGAVVIGMYLPIFTIINQVK